MGKSEAENRKNQFSLHRLESLTDGIYAIAMTILVLSLPMPQIAGVSTDSDVISHFSDIAELFGTYALSFLLLGNFWIIQLKIFKYIKASSIPHLWANLAGLLVVCLIPFSSSLMGYHNHTFSANLFFHINIFLISAFFVVQCKVLLLNPETIADQFDESAIRRVILINMLLPLVSLLGIGIAFVSPEWSTAVYLAVPFLTIRLKTKIHNASKDRLIDL